MLFLFVVAFFAGIVDAIAGGSGLITLPTLMNAIPDPLVALGTNKLQGVCGVLSSGRYFIRKGIVRLHENRLLLAMTFLGSLGGAAAAKILDKAVLVTVIPFLLLGAAAYFLFLPVPQENRALCRLSYPVFAVLMGVLLGFYDGFLGPGTGSFWMMALILLRGQSMLSAVGGARVMNACSNLASCAFYVLHAKVLWVSGLVMGLGQILGARLGAALAWSGGPRLIRPVIVLVCLAMIGRQLADHPDHPLRRAIDYLWSLL